MYSLFRRKSEIQQEPFDVEKFERRQEERKVRQVELQAKFPIGGVIKHKSGGPNMVVRNATWWDHHQVLGVSALLSGGYLVAAWIDSLGQPHVANFGPDEVENVG